MADVIIKTRITIENPDTNPEQTQEKIKQIIEKEQGKIHQTEIKPYVFGLKAIELTFIIPEKDGGTDKIEEEIKKIPEIGNLEILQISRTLG